MDATPQTENAPNTPKVVDSRQTLESLLEALQTAHSVLNNEEKRRYWLIVDKDWEDLSIEEYTELEQLRQRLRSLRTELISRLRRYSDSNLRVHIFFGRRLYITNWPVWAILDGDKALPLTEMGNLSPGIAKDGSLLGMPEVVSQGDVSNETSENPAETG